MIAFWVLSHPTEPLQRLSKQTPFWVLSQVANTIAIQVEQRFAEPANGSVERLSLTFATTPITFVSPLQQICSTAGAYE
jgi:hypothetical protein